MIIINRHSVCMGDDVEDHSMSIEVTDSDTFSSLFYKVRNLNYFPSVWGNDVVWVLVCNSDDLISWLTKSDSLFTRFVSGEPTINSNSRWRNESICFHFYSPLIKRAEHIFNMHNGQKFHIWHEGFMPEYRRYQIDDLTEEKWLKNLKK